MGQIASSVSAGMKSTMEENFKRQMNFQMDAFQLQMERQLVMQNEMRERQLAMQIGRSREIVKYYYGPFYAFVVTGGLLGAIKMKKPAYLVPSIPLGFVFAFQYDMAYGTLMQRARDTAEQVMVEERNRLKVPHGMPTFEGVEEKRLAAKTT